MRRLDGITDSMDMGLGELRELVMTGRPGVLRFIGSQRVGHDCATELNVQSAPASYSFTDFPLSKCYTYPFEKPPPRSLL